MPARRVMIQKPDDGALILARCPFREPQRLEPHGANPHAVWRGRGAILESALSADCGILFRAPPVGRRAPGLHDGRAGPHFCRLGAFLHPSAGSPPIGPAARLA
jgi:hypothetical protein